MRKREKQRKRGEGIRRVVALLIETQRERERESGIGISCGDSIRTYVTSYFDTADQVFLF
jgi:hypothetical protein